MLKDECHSSQEVEFAKEWFRSVYIEAEHKAASKWLKYRDAFNLVVDGVNKRIDINENLFRFNQLMERLWYKYHYNAMRVINNKYRPRKEFKELKETDLFFEHLPESCIFNVNEYGFF